MDQIFNDPLIKNFFQTIKQTDKKLTLKELVLLGIQAVSSKIHETGCRCCSNHCGCCGCVKINRNWQANPPQNSNGACHCGNQRSGSNNNVAQELEQLKNRINQLSSNYNQTPSFQMRGNNQNSKQKNFTRSPSKQVQLIQQNENFSITNNGQIKQFRHHLDDTQVRKALVNPYAKASPIKNEKKKKSIQKGHLLQKQRDAEAIKMNRQKMDPFQQTQHEQIQNFSNARLANVVKQSDKKLKKTALNVVNEQINNDQSYQMRPMMNKNTNHNGAKSKIKSLIQKDKQRNKKTAFSKKQQYSKSKYCQFQYSDESELESQDAASESSCPVHSHRKEGIEQSEQDSSMQAQNNNYSRSQNQRAEKSYQQKSKKSHSKQEWQSYKENRKRIKQIKQSSSKEVVEEQSEHQSNGYEKQEDQVSQSSSFSKFSMSSGRENGKIIGLRK